MLKKVIIYLITFTFDSSEFSEKVKAVTILTSSGLKKIHFTLRRSVRSINWRQSFFNE